MLTCSSYDSRLVFFQTHSHLYLELNYKHCKLYYKYFMSNHNYNHKNFEMVQMLQGSFGSTFFLNCVISMKD